jgi:hypothetical protein
MKDIDIAPWQPELVHAGYLSGILSNLTTA